MAYVKPTVAEFKAYFYRDFPYGTNPECNVIDADITKAFGQANVNFNQKFFADQESFTIGYMLLTAHFLVVDLRMSSQGLSGQFNWLETSKSVGSVSQGFQVPQRILDNPEFAMLSQTNYGAKYLQLLLPQLAGQMFIAYGHTLP